MKNNLISALCFFLLISAIQANAASKDEIKIHDFTKGDKPGELADHNLGTTGARGWVDGRRWDALTSGNIESYDARQIYITMVHKGSPADGILKPGDVILGVEGKKFDSDARKSFGKALTRAEAEKGKLKVLRWREGKTEEVTIQIKVMGSYSKTAPWDCKKSKKIIEDACDYIIEREKTVDPNKNIYNGRGMVDTLALMATGKKEYLPLVKKRVYKIVEKVEKSGDNPPVWGYPSWGWGYGNLLLTEYYLLTKDRKVLPAIKKFTMALSLGQSDVGTWGHSMSLSYMSYGKPHGRLAAYGAMNQSGTICWMSLVLAEKCGIRHPEISLAIKRGYEYLAFYINKQSIPYGDMVMMDFRDHDDNGKNSAAARGFAICGDKEGAEFFGKMTAASYAIREKGHTGNYWSHLWGMLGASAIGKDACGAFLNEMAWLHDLERRWDGGFCSNGRFEGKGYTGDEKKDLAERGNSFTWDITGTRLLSFCLSQKKLYITGKGAPSIKLTSKEIKDVIDAGRWDGRVREFRTKYDNESVETIFGHLNSWSPVIRDCAAISLAKKPGDHVERLIKVLYSKDSNGRYGACRALRELGPKAKPAVDELIKALSAKDPMLKISAAITLGAIGDKRAAEPMLKMVIKGDPDDKTGMIERYLAHALFNSARYVQYKGLFAKSTDGVDSKLFDAAIIRILKGKDGQTRCFAADALVRKYPTPENLTPELWEAMILALRNPAPTLVMRSEESRMIFAKYLARNKIEEGLPLLIEYLKNQKWHGTKDRTVQIINLIKNFGTGVKKHEQELKDYCAYLDNLTKTNSFRAGDIRHRSQIIKDKIPELMALKKTPQLISIEEILKK